ncbi:MAG: hypothetical protein KC731_01970 [Myxococcales bacterium]|nr:hypothetical protein [Myxococcales bacterium]
MPFAWSAWSSYREFRGYLDVTLDAPNPPWTRGTLDPDGCVEAALRWIEPCPGLEELCRRGLPTVVHRCLEAADRAPFCAQEREALERSTYGYDTCQAHVAAGRLDDTRMHRQRCAIAYRAVAEWCEAQPRTAAMLTMEGR